MVNYTCLFYFTRKRENMKPFMKKELIRKLTAIVVLAALVIGCIWMDMPEHFGTTGTGPSHADAAGTASTNPATGGAISGSTQELRGIWIAFCDWDALGLSNKSEEVFTKNARKLFANCKKNYINTVYFHVVPCNDAIYPSKYLKWSSYMFKSAPDYDPLKILVREAHSYDLSFQAWLNPYRQKMGKVFNPAASSSTNRILRNVKEIAKNYDVDGIHFDDYFYPAKTRGYQYYSVSIAKRKRVINRMVRKVYKTVKSIDRDLDFSISPAGNIEYAESLGCDLKTWMSGTGYMDYIVPQIYWSDCYRIGGKNTKMYSERLERWNSMNTGDLPMVIGLALYHAGWNSGIDRGWRRSSTNIATQIKKERKSGCQGFVLFSAANLTAPIAKKEMNHYRSLMKSAQ